MRKLDLTEVKNFIQAQSLETKIYIGADSERYQKVIDGRNQWFADYILVVVVHIDGCHGCKIFGEVQTERDYDAKASRPSTRLMTEVYKVAELFIKMEDVLDGRDVEVHLDINPNEMYTSSIVVQQAVGYIKGVCNITPRVKPNAFAASYAADRFKSVMA